MIGHVSYGGFAGGKRYNNPGRIDASHGYVYGGSQGNRNTYTRRSGSNRSFGQRRDNNGFNNNSNFGTRNNSVSATAAALVMAAASVAAA